jgi:EAL domain-containing protein (putative c-di-GMP-specific phosphodiesterase class I)
MEISRAIIAMAHRLRLKIVFEGVETAERLEFLRSEGATRYRGTTLPVQCPRRNSSTGFRQE